MVWSFDRYSESHERLRPVQDSAKGGKVGLSVQPSPFAPRDWQAVLETVAYTIHEGPERRSKNAAGNCD